MRMREWYLFVGCFAAATALVTAAEGGWTSAAQASNVAVCHVRGNGTFHLLNVNGHALQAHVAHGDAKPGDPVPGVDRKIFDQDCNQVDAPVDVPPDAPPDVPPSCPCWDARSLPLAPADFCSVSLTNHTVVFAGGSYYIVDLANSLCYVKSGDPALAVSPTQISPEQGNACVTSLMPICPRDPAPLR